ncbi:MAG: hypothetical protein GY743_23550 [Planctomycetaceae bacterium]|nr:hypothetical protein [Planctomycetaceae bacterium]
MIDVTKDQVVETQDEELIELWIEDGNIMLVLACEVEKAGVADHVETRAMSIAQVDNLIQALKKAKADL